MNISEYISTLSFIDKDFPALYTDVLDLAKKLTNDWDPSKSNESDPAVVLIKLATFLADHLNYNIDKNILENFLPTATQETSVRNIVEMNGYNPRYYISASGDVTFVYNPKTALESSFTIPAFSIVLTNDKNDIVYTQADPLLVLPDKISSDCRFIEGTKVDLLVNGDKNILLENLDANNRLYIPTKNVAQNGLYVTSTSTTTVNAWQEVNYLNIMPLGSYVYKLGYDSNKELPYIEFPNDIANLIGSGINVSYIVTSGLNGNISSDTLTKIQSMSNSTWSQSLKDLNISTDDFKIVNKLPFINGKNPETIDEMYRSFRQIVGTFNTLVTRRDYKNAIREIEVNSFNNEPVSNCNVTDYLTDFNNSTSVVTLNAFGEYTEHITNNKKLNLLTSEPVSKNIGDAWINSDSLLSVVVGKDSSNEAIVESFTIGEAFNNYIESMSPYDLCVYAFRAYQTIFPDNTTNNALSYVPVNDGVIEDISESINDYKAINHTINSPKDGDIVMIKNNVPLNVTIMPYNKVTNEQAEDIVNVATNVVAEKFAANSLEFGEELNYDSVLQALINADDRIKDVRLEDFTYSPSVIIKDSSKDTGFDEKPISAYMTSIVAKNILAGKLSMFHADPMVTFPFECANRETCSNVKTIEPSLTISTTGDLPLTGNLADYESIHILWPSTTEDIIYPAYVDYSCNIGDKTISANTEYTLQQGESLVISYTQNGIPKTTTYSENTIIKPSFDLKTTTGDNNYIATGNTISIMKLMSTKVDLAVVYCTWNRKNSTNTLFVNNETEVILGTGEFFAYSNAELTTFVFFGTGTKLVRANNANDNSWTLEEGSVDPDSISTLKNVWKQMNLSSSGSGSVTCNEMNSLTIGSGYSFEINGIANGAKSLNSSWTTCNSIKYKTSTDTDFTSLTGATYSIKASLAINCGPSDSQKIASREDANGSASDQSVVLTYGDSSTTTIENKSIVSSIVIDMPGDNIIESSIDNLIIEAITTGDEYDTTLTEDGSATATKLIAVNNAYYINTTKNSTLSAHLSYDKTKKCIIPIYLSSGSIISITSSPSTSTCSEYIFEGSLENISAPKLINLFIDADQSAADNNKTLEIKISADSSVQILSPIVYSDLNNAIVRYNSTVEESNKITEANLISYIKDVINGSSNVNVRPRLKSTVHNDDAIQIDDFSDPYVLFDINNVINQYVLPAIDFKNSNIGIYKSMRLLR